MSTRREQTHCVWSELSCTKALPHYLTILLRMMCPAIYVTNIEYTIYTIWRYYREWRVPQYLPLISMMPSTLSSDIIENGMSRNMPLISRRPSTLSGAIIELPRNICSCCQRDTPQNLPLTLCVARFDTACVWTICDSRYESSHSWKYCAIRHSDSRIQCACSNLRLWSVPGDGPLWELT